MRETIFGMFMGLALAVVVWLVLDIVHETGRRDVHMQCLTFGKVEIVKKIYECSIKEVTK